MASRRRGVTPVRAVVVGAATACLLASCASTSAPHAGPSDGDSTLSADEVSKAIAAARAAIVDQDASLTTATVIKQAGTQLESNTGHPCTSGHELQIKLIGSFPNTLTTGRIVLGGGPRGDSTVRAIFITADAETGIACLIGVGTNEAGAQEPLPGGTSLLMG